MRGITQYWITGLAVLVGVFLVLMAFGLGADDSGDLSTGVQILLAFLAMGVPGLALFGGLWNLRSGRYSRAVSYIGIVIGLIAAGMWFWLLLPPIVALVVLWFGVIRQGLARELASHVHDL